MVANNFQSIKAGFLGSGLWLASMLKDQPAAQRPLTDEQRKRLPRKVSPSQAEHSPLQIRRAFEIKGRLNVHLRWSKHGRA